MLLVLKLNCFVFSFVFFLLINTLVITVASFYVQGYMKSHCLPASCWWRAHFEGDLLCMCRRSAQSARRRAASGSWSTCSGTRWSVSRTCRSRRSQDCSSSTARWTRWQAASARPPPRSGTSCQATHAAPKSGTACRLRIAQFSCRASRTRMWRASRRAPQCS